MFHTLKLRRGLSILPIVTTGVALLATSPSGLAMDSVLGGTLPGQVFPTDNPWNQDISTWPADPNSATYIAAGGTLSLHADLGGDAPNQLSPNATYGIPYIVVSNVQASDLVAVQFTFSQTSDGVDHSTDTSYPFYPIPPQAATQAKWIEGGDPGNIDLRTNQDRHMLIVDSDRNYLYELYNVYFDESTNQWYAATGAFWDLNTNQRRPDTWMSADGAGLAILPGLLRYDEVYGSNAEINHAFRFTVNNTNSYVFPAAHWHGFITGAPPLGTRLRLRADVDIAGRTSDPAIQKIFRAMQKHGLILADSGSNLYVTGTYDKRWDNDLLNRAFAKITAADFEVIEFGYPETKPAALASISLSPGTVVRGSNVSLTINLSAPAPSGGAVVSLYSSHPQLLPGPTKTTIPEGKSSITLTGKTSTNMTTDTSITVGVGYKLIKQTTTLNILMQ